MIKSKDMKYQNPSFITEAVNEIKKRGHTVVFNETQVQMVVDQLGLDNVRVVDRDWYYDIFKD